MHLYLNVQRATMENAKGSRTGRSDSERNKVKVMSDTIWKLGRKVVWIYMYRPMLLLHTRIDIDFKVNSDRKCEWTTSTNEWRKGKSVIYVGKISNGWLKKTNEWRRLQFADCLLPAAGQCDDDDDLLICPQQLNRWPCHSLSHWLTD